MADNSTANPGSGGDAFRSLQTATAEKWPASVLAKTTTETPGANVLTLIKDTVPLPVVARSSTGTELATVGNPFRIDPTGTTTQPVSAVSLPLPAGAATSANQAAGQGQLVDNAAFTDTTTRLDMAGFIFDETAGTALTENDAAAARVDSKRAQVTVLEDATTRAQRQAVNAGGAAEVHGDVAHNVAVSGNPVLNGYEGRTTDGAAVTSGNAVRGLADTLGKQVVMVGAVHDRHVNGRANFTTTTAADIIAAQGAGVRIVVMSYSITNSSQAVNTKVELRDGTTVRVIDHAQSTGGGAARAGGSPIFISTANTAVTGRCVTTGADVEINVSGYTIAN